MALNLVCSAERVMLFELERFCSDRDRLQRPVVLAVVAVAVVAVLFVGPLQRLPFEVHWWWW